MNIRANTVVKKDCFAYHGKSCTALKVMECAGCEFYKKKSPPPDVKKKSYYITDWDRENIRKLYADGYPIVEIAKMTGWSTPTVKRVIEETE